MGFNLSVLPSWLLFSISSKFTSHLTIQSSILSTCPTHLKTELSSLCPSFILFHVPIFQPFQHFTLSSPIVECFLSSFLRLLLAPFPSSPFPACFRHLACHCVQVHKDLSTFQSSISLQWKQAHLCFLLLCPSDPSRLLYHVFSGKSWSEGLWRSHIGILKTVLCVCCG